MTEAEQGELDDRYYHALMVFVRICRGDDRLEGANPSLRRRLVRSHLGSVATDFNIDRAKLGALVIDMMSGENPRAGIASLPVSNVKPAGILEPTEPGKYAGDIFFGDPKDLTRGTHLWCNGYEGWKYLADPEQRMTTMVYAKPEDPDFDATSARMGYDGMVRATTRMIDGLRYEFGIVDMSESNALGSEATPWAVVVHQDCDPDAPDQGASSRNDHATYELALADFEEEIRNAEAKRPFGI